MIVGRWGRHRDDLWQFARFVVVGVVNTSFSYALYALLLWCGLPFAIANLLSLLVGIVFSFVTQGTFVFANRDGRRLLRFALVWTLLYGVNIALIGRFVLRRLQRVCERRDGVAADGRAVVHRAEVLRLPRGGEASRHRVMETIASSSLPTGAGFATRGRIHPAVRDVALLTIAWIAMIAIVNPWGDFPVNDDWVYAAAVRSLITTGRFEIYSFSSANVGPLVYWGALFAKVSGFSFDALRVANQLLGLLTIVAVYGLVLEVWANRVVAAVAAWMLLVSPLYFVLANTFMTDVPFLGCVAASLWAMVAGMRRDRMRLVVFGVAIALAGVLLRQFAVTLLCGFALGYVAWRGPTWKNAVVAVVPLVIGLMLNRWFTEWLVASGRKPYPSGIPTLLTGITPAFPWLVRSTLFIALSQVGLLTMPLALVCLPAWRGVVARRRTVAWIALAAGVATLVAAYASRRLTVPIGGNIVWWYGLGPLTNGDTLMQNRNLPVMTTGAKAAWSVATLAAIVASSTLLVALAVAARRFIGGLRGPLARPRGRALATGGLVVGTAVAYLAILLLVALGYEVFDRYMLPLAVAAMLALPLAVGVPIDRFRPSRMRLGLAIATCVAWAAFSIVATHDFFAWSRARWDGLQALMASGVSPHRIDGGYEFDGWYLYDPRYRWQKPKNWWWVDDDEYLVASGPRAGYRVEQVWPVDRWWRNGAPDLTLLHRDGESRPAPR